MSQLGTMFVPSRVYIMWQTLPIKGFGVPTSLQYIYMCMCMSVCVCLYVFVDFSFCFFLLKSESDNADLLYHPLVRSLLKYKWDSFGHKLFFANLLLYLSFLLCLTAFALMSLGPLEQTCKQKLIQISLVVWGCYCIQTNLDSKIPLACWYGNANGFYFQHASVITKSYIILLGCVVLLYSQGLSNWCFHHHSFFSLAEPEFIHETKPGDYGSKSSVTSGNKAKVSMMCNWGCEHLATAVVFHF